MSAPVGDGTRLGDGSGTPSAKTRIPLTQGAYAQVDASDFDWLAAFKWCAHRDKSRGFYAQREANSCVILMHRAIMNPPEGFQVDHINGDGLDNRRCNLRLASVAENSWNRIKRHPTASGYKGVSISVCSRTKKVRWRSAIAVQKKRIHLGVFQTEIEAAQAYNEAALEFYGEFARLNKFAPENGGTQCL